MANSDPPMSRSTRADFPDIAVRWPQRNDIVGDVLEVSGIGRTQEGVISSRVVDGNGEQLCFVLAQVGRMGVFARFNIGVTMAHPTTPHGSVEVFEYFEGDGSELHKVVVPITFGRFLLGDQCRGFDIYEVRSGDSLSSVASTVYGDPGLWRRLYEANRYQIDDPNLIRPGQVLRVAR